MTPCVSTSTKPTEFDGIKVPALPANPLKEVTQMAETSLTIHLPWRYREEGVIERLEAIANQEGRSVDDVIAQALLEYLDREESS